MTTTLNAPSPLSTSLAEQALTEADQPAHAVSALMSGAAAILTRDFGPEVAAELMLGIVMETRHALICSGLVAESTRH